MATSSSNAAVVLAAAILASARITAAEEAGASEAGGDDSLYLEWYLAGETKPTSLPADATPKFLLEMRDIPAGTATAIIRSVIATKGIRVPIGSYVDAITRFEAFDAAGDLKRIEEGLRRQPHHPEDGRPACEALEVVCHMATLGQGDQELTAYCRERAREAIVDARESVEKPGLVAGDKLRLAYNILWMVGDDSGFAATAEEAEDRIKAFYRKYERYEVPLYGPDGRTTGSAFGYRKTRPEPERSRYDLDGTCANHIRWLLPFSTVRDSIMSKHGTERHLALASRMMGWSEGGLFQEWARVRFLKGVKGVERDRVIRSALRSLLESAPSDSRTSPDEMRRRAYFLLMMYGRGITAAEMVEIRRTNEARGMVMALPDTVLPDDSPELVPLAEERSTAIHVLVGLGGGRRRAGGGPCGHTVPTRCRPPGACGTPSRGRRVNRPCRFAT